MKSHIKNQRHLAILWIFLMVLTQAAVSENRPIAIDEQLTVIFKEARETFFTTMDMLLEKHFRKSELTKEDLERLRNARTNIPYLFERIINIAYQKDEPIYTQWIQEGNKPALDKLRQKFILLARDYAGRFVGSLFRKTPLSDFSMKLPHNQGKSTLDLVLQTLGYNVNNKLPDYPQKKWFTNPIEEDIRTQWCIDAVNARKCWNITKGKDVVVAVLDSGIDPYNAFFKDRLVPGFNFLERTTPPWSDEQPPMIDYGLHGTGVSSVLLAVAPECRIMMIRTGDADTMNDPPYDYWLYEYGAAGIYYAVHHGAHVISKSSALRSIEPVTAWAVRYAYEHNVPICSSAGNFPRVHLGLKPEDVLYRAFDKEVLLIGGAEKNERGIRPWLYSVPGPYVDVVAPSKDIFILVPVYLPGMKNQNVAGTSLSAPIAAGVVAMMRSYAPPTESMLKKPGFYIHLVTETLQKTAKLEDLGMFEPSEAAGHGLIDALAAVRKIKERMKEPYQRPKYPK
jgi:hypothetical protein